MKQVEWNSFGERRAWRLAIALLPAWRRRVRRHAGVAGVEVGVKRRGGLLVQPRTPCLKFFVYRKGTHDWTTELPQAIRVSVGGKRVTHVPTDVEEILDLDPQGATTRAAALSADDEGSTGFRVRRGDGDYLVSAAHVLETGAPDFEARWSKLGINGGGIVQPSSCWQLRRDPDSGETGFVDAGLVTIVDPGILPDLTRHPWGQPAVRWEEVDELSQVFICGKHGVVRAHFETRCPTGTHLDSYPYWRHLRFVYESGMTDPGDSGAPVISSDGCLVGMHFAHQHDETSGTHFGLAFCAGDLLDHFGGALLVE